MTGFSPEQGRQLKNMAGPTDIPQKIRFRERGAFFRDLEAAVDAYFEETGKSRRDLPRMYLKTVVILSWFVGSWAALVFAAQTFLQGTLCAVSLGLSIAAVGMSIQHDANHGAYSSRPWVNKIFGATLDLMGVFSFIWRPKHNTGHHTFTNIEGVDYDLDFGNLARLSPGQTHHSWHRYQHVYLWFLYGLLLPKWVFYDDFVIVKTGVIGVHKLPKPGAADMASFVIWKIIFVAWGFVIPAMFHPLWQVFLFHLIAVFALGVPLGTMFQLAHCVDSVEFPEPPQAGDRMPTDWAEHQLATTSDFGANNPLLTWFSGGLNFQVVHHLFPKVCHLHYPALAHIVARVAGEHGLKYRSQASYFDAISSHFNHLRRLGQASALAPTPAPTEVMTPGE